MKQTEALDLSAEALWRYSLQRYQSSRLQEQLLQLQDQYSGHVNLALVCLWLDDLKLKLTQTSLTELEQSLTETHSYLVSLRTTRRLLRTHVSPEQYQQLLDIEITLEKQQQQCLVKCLSDLKLNQHAKPKNYTNYLKYLGIDS